MKKNALSLSALALATALYGHTAHAELPRDFQEFKARYQQEGRVPEGALKLYFEAVFCYIDEATRSEGAKMLRYAMHLDRPLEQAGSYATFVSRMQDPDENYVFRSFAAGTSPQKSPRKRAFCCWLRKNTRSCPNIYAAWQAQQSCRLAGPAMTPPGGPSRIVFVVYGGCRPPPYRKRPLSFQTGLRQGSEPKTVCLIRRGFPIKIAMRFLWVPGQARQHRISPA